MLVRRNRKVINVQTIEHDELIKMIENMDGVRVKRTGDSVKISIHKRALAKCSVGISVKRKNKKGKRLEHLTPIYGTEKRDISQFRQSSAIIAKSY